MNQIIVLSGTLLLILIGCNTPNSPQNEMQFRVNPELLGEWVQLDSNGIQFRPPHTFLPWETDEVAGILSDRSNLIYKDSLSEAYMLIATQGNLENPLDNLANARIEDSVSNATQFWQDVQEDEFPYKGLRIHQVLRQTPQWVDFRLEISHEENEINPILCDFLIAREAYSLPMVECIESSIGSFQPM